MKSGLERIHKMTFLKINKSDDSFFKWLKIFDCHEHGRCNRIRNFCRVLNIQVTYYLLDVKDFELKL